jgi:signal transduction histidine kinase/PAS domain-containing protein
VISRILRRLGHEVIEAPDGRTGLAAVRERRPALVVADVDMPHLDGLRLCRLIREDPGLAAIPVVLITAYLPPRDPRLSGAGAATVVTKPFSVQDLTAVFRRHLPDSEPVTAGDRGDGTAAEMIAGWLGSDALRADADARAFVEALLRGLDVGVVACDAAGTGMLLNRALGDLFGEDLRSIPLPEWPRRLTMRHHDGTDLRPGEMPLSRALAGEPVRHLRLRVQDRRDRPRWLIVNAEPVSDGAGGPVLGAVAAVHDVTAEYRARQYYDCKTEVLQVLTAGLGTAAAGAAILRAIAGPLGWPYMRLWLVDPVIDRLRPAATYTAPGERPLPVPSSFERGHGLAGTCWATAAPVWVSDMHAGESPVLPEIVAASPYRAAGAVPVRGGDRVVGVITFFSHDRQEQDPALSLLLTGIAGHIGAYLEQRRAEELDLRLAASADEYVALVGHELRTPLTSIAAYTELIGETPDGTPFGEVRAMIDVVARNTRRLHGLIDQLLDLAALESGHVELAEAPVDLTGVVRDAVGAVAATAAERRITVHGDTAVPVTVRGDAARLRQVADQLIGNALKFSPDGAAVTVTLTTDELAAQLSVSDTGIGIPEGEHARTLRRLYRATNARDGAIPGTGLGLTVSRTIVERHHGTITLQPREPVGTTVTVRLPVVVP